METRPLGSVGPAVSIVGLGCNNFGGKLGAAESAAVVHTALDSGITHFDTAEMYGDGASEEFLGAALGPRRDAAVIGISPWIPRSSDRGGNNAPCWTA